MKKHLSEFDLFSVLFVWAFSVPRGTAADCFVYSQNSSNLYKALNTDAEKLSSKTNILDEGKSFKHERAASQIQLMVLRSAEMCPLRYILSP